ncbi:MAG: DNA polymerase IV [Burkholderiaceae bacterium]|nr:DNA polymerase IV [Burkholderiaceae bacterium]
MPDPSRVIAHLDMDAFYASVELLRYPELRGMSVVIGGGSRQQPRWENDAQGGAPRRVFARLRDYVGRGVITTATYEARAFGVNSAMGLMKAAKKVPDAILLPTDFDEYRKYSRLFKAAVQAIAPQVEDRGIDEIYIDLTELVAARLTPGDESEARRTRETDTWWSAREIALELKLTVRDATGLSCSIGLAPNKLIAKIASELNKPDGLAIITAPEIEARLWPLPVRRMHGVGPKSAAKLGRLGIASIGELAQAEPAWLAQNFGKANAAWMHDAANGRDDRPVVTLSEPKSISRETTFDRDLHPVHDRAQLTRIFSELCAELSSDLQRKQYASKTIGIKLRFENFKTVTRDSTLATPTDDAAEIRRAAGECLKRVELEKRIRLLGVRAGSLLPT